MAATVRMVKLGRMSYSAALKVQESTVAQIKAKRSPSTLFIVEHQAVYTTGVRTNQYNAVEERRLRELGADFIRSNRGGLITFHGPGQLVAYPILNLAEFFPVATARKAILGVKWYVERLEQTVIDTCGDVGVEAVRSPPHPGVWVPGEPEEKVCALGVHSSNLVTSHGLALNCDVDLEWFSHIVPCGIPDRGVTSLTRVLGRRVTTEEVLPILVRNFEKSFACSVVREDTDESKEEEI